MQSVLQARARRAALGFSWLPETTLRAHSAQVLNQVATTLLGLAVVFFGGVATLMKPVERSIEQLEKKVDDVEKKVGDLEKKVGAVEKKVDSLALVTQTTLVLTILGSAAAALRSSGLQLPAV